MKTKLEISELSGAVETVNNKKAANKARLRTIMLCSLMLLTTMPTFAIVGKINGWETDIKDALNAAVLIFAIVGGFLIFIQYMQGNEQAQKNLIRYIIGMAIFALASEIIQLFLIP